jgi:uncharacterized membrane protein
MNFRLPRRWRNALLTIHIIASVALLGDVMGFMAIAVRMAGTDDPAVVLTSVGILETFSATFGIPLTLLSLVSGIVLGLGTHWGVLQHPWTMIKLALNVSVAVVGTLVLGPAEGAIRAGTGTATPLIAGAAWDIAALGTAVVLSVYKPGRRVTWRRARAATEPRRAVRP